MRRARSRGWSRATRCWSTACPRRSRSWTIVAAARPASRVLYPGSFVDIAPSFVFPQVTYVDMDDRALRFFADRQGVEDVLVERQASSPSGGGSASINRTTPSTGSSSTVAPSGISVAAAILTVSRSNRRSPVSDEPRGPYCMMGVCFECLATVDGIASVQSCLVTVKDGMRIERQIGAREVGL